ncbi:MAG TPA: hypothetical protein VKQ54_04550 [Caulobacteraceae bacterium]|nr:hypothetical protein [Caulobacteraceae bacterium]
MRDIIDVRGASGGAYRFTRFRDGNPLSAMGGNFIYARPAGSDKETAGGGAGDGAEMVYAGEAQNLLTDARRLWDQAVATHGVTDLFTRLNISERVRRQELADILAAARPPMNAAEEGAE